MADSDPKRVAHARCSGRAMGVVSALTVRHADSAVPARLVGEEGQKEMMMSRLSGFEVKAQPVIGSLSSEWWNTR